MRRTAGESFRLISRLMLAGSLSVFIFGCSDDDGGTDPVNDTTAPVVVDISPQDGSSGISLNTAVTVTFSESVEPASCTTQSIHLSGGVNGTVDVAGKMVTLTPSSALAPMTEYDVTITTGICDLAGNAMAQAFASSFTTAGLPVADPGHDFYVARGRTVSIDASRSSGTTGGPLDFEWTQTAGPQVQVLTGATPSFTAPDDVTALVFSLVVIDDGVESDPAQVRILVLEDPAHAYFVHKSGSDQGTGSLQDPFVTIGRAIGAARDENAGGDVYVAAGDYSGSLELNSDVSIYGGFDPATWERDDTGLVTRILGGTTAIEGNGAHDLVLDRLSVESADGDAFGGSSIAIVLRNCTGLELTRSRIRAGDGENGLPGSDGRNGEPGANGSSGSARSGGAGAAGPGNPGGNGGAGGPDWYGGDAGHAGEPVGAGGGAAGARGDYNSRGGNGGNGADAPLMAGDGPGGDPFGGWDAAELYQPAFGGRGAQVHGAGGGGGGGGGAEGVYNGGGGGGGGAGGEGGVGGEGGQGGGASIAIALYAGSEISVSQTVLATGAGGRGGWGGVGGQGAAGGTGGGSGTPQSDGFWLEGEKGGTGGTGGHGGQGGYGGGGGGGPVIGILSIQSECVRTGLVFELGAPGAGGERPDTNGTTGSTGESAEYKAMN